VDADGGNLIVFKKPLAVGRTAYDNFAELQRLLTASVYQDVKLEITWEGRLGRTFLFLIMCLLNLADEHKKTVTITVSNKIYSYLNDMQFLDSFKMRITPGADLRFCKLDGQEDTLRMARNIVKDIPAELSPRLHIDMVYKLGEMFNNAREHSGTAIVVGCRYTKPKKFCIACYDTGIGIVEKVREFHKNANIYFSDEDALKWAIAPNNSTAVNNDNIPRGAGLGFLKAFARLNSGVIRICTGKILYTYKGEEDSEKYQELENCFMGTLFEMDINADDRRYSYKEEQSNDQH